MPAQPAEMPRQHHAMVGDILCAAIIGTVYYLCTFLQMKPPCTHALDIVEISLPST